MNRNEQWLQWAVELQSLAQAGLHYSKDPFDVERFQRVREIAVEMLHEKSGIPVEKVRELFCCETGYQTPKLDTRAAIFQDDKIYWYGNAVPETGLCRAAGSMSTCPCWKAPSRKSGRRPD